LWIREGVFYTGGKRGDLPGTPKPRNANPKKGESYCEALEDFPMNRGDTPKDWRYFWGETGEGESFSPGGNL